MFGIHILTNKEKESEIFKYTPSITYYLHTDRLGFELGSNGRQGQDGTYTRLYALRRDSARP